MTPFPRIMVPLSQTESDVGLMKYARRLADAGISSDFLFAHAAPAGQPDLELAQRRSIAEALVGTHFGSPSGTRSTIEIGSASRIDWLIEAAIGFKADLTLLGHRRARSGTRSLARRLTEIAPCSVWVVPEGAAANVQRVLAPVDFSEHARDGLSVATSVARAFAIDRCLALHVSFDSATMLYHENVVAAQEDERAAFDAFVKKVDLHGVTVTPLFEQSPKVAKTILRTAATEQADLIVMSTRGRSRAVAILLGSVTAQVMAESPVPVLAVKHAGARMNLFQILTDRRLWSQPDQKTN